MRAEGGCASNAPVDTMGCSKLHDEDADPATQRFQSLVALVLSSMTRDEQTAKAMVRWRVNFTPCEGCS